MKTEKIYFGATYYDEYMPESRVEEDMALMSKAGMNIIRIAESTWSTWEPRDGEFQFLQLRRMLEAAARHDISVIVGTPTYAIPPWLAKKYPDILAETHTGPCRYGHRQLMDITHPGYRFHCERIIRRLMEEVQPYGNVIGFQLDNETKPYDTCGPRAQAMFLEWLKEKFGTVEKMNHVFGLAYWSNSLGSWEDMPDVRGTICGSLAAEFEAFQRNLVTEFIAWQRRIVDEYRRPEQFVTHNFDYEWHDYSYGLQPDVEQFDVMRSLTVPGCDIYYPSGAKLTGAEISFCGDIARGLAGGENFLVLETQAQGQMGRLPYPGQLRLSAFAHLANGANMVEYWHWHSIHNGIECYWKGVLSHDFSPGAVYQEVASVGKELARLGEHLVNLKRTSSVAILLSNRSLTGVKHSAALAGPSYNDCVRWLYDALFRMNIPCDIIPDTTRDFSEYQLVVLPCLYCCEDALTNALREYVMNGGHLLASFRSFFTDEHVKIRHIPQPAGMTDLFGMTYDNMTLPENIPHVSAWMELLKPYDGTQVLSGYSHYAYAGYASATLHTCGKGSAAYLGAMFDAETLDKLLSDLLPQFGLSIPAEHWPLIIKEGRNALGCQVRYLFNHSDGAIPASIPADCRELLSGRSLYSGDCIQLEPWHLVILEWDISESGSPSSVTK